MDWWLATEGIFGRCERDCHSFLVHLLPNMFQIQLFLFIPREIEWERLVVPADLISASIGGGGQKRNFLRRRKNKKKAVFWAVCIPESTNYGTLVKFKVWTRRQR